MKKIVAITGIIGLAALSRLLPHPPNFTAIGAIALFGGAMYKHKIWSFIIPLIALWASDLIINNALYGSYYEGFAWLTPGAAWIYLGVIAMVIIGILRIRKIGIKSIAIAGISASLVFFLLSNFGAWMVSGLYPPTFAGLMSCYVAGLPFLLSTMAGTLFYSGVLFGGYVWISKKYGLNEMVTV